MKSILKITALLLMLAPLGSCSDSNEKSKREVKTDMLTESAWGHALVVNSTDGDLSDQYTDFVISFSGNSSDGYDGSFIISNGGYAFSEIAGKWKFNDDLDQIILDSEKEMDIQLTDGHLQLDFTVPAPGGKAAGLSGHFIFDLQPL